MSVEDFNNYDPENVTVSFRGVDIKGVAKGTFIKVEREVKTWTKKVGSTGSVTRSRSRDRTGKMTLTLMDGSPSNDLLMAMFLSDELRGDGVGAFQVRDFSGNMRCNCVNAWISEPPKIERAEESGNTVWEFECADLTINAGGNVE